MVSALFGGRGGEPGNMMRGPVAYVFATAVVGVSTGVDWLLRESVSESDLVMVYLLGVLVVARLLALGPALWAAAASVAAFDVLFVPPRFTFAVSETRYIISFAVMGATGLVLASTTARIRMEASRARERAQRLQVLNELSRDLMTTELATDIAEIATARLRRSLGVDAQVLPAGTPPTALRHAIDIPLQGTSERLGLLRVTPADSAPTSAATRETLAAFARQLTLGLERARLFEARRRAEMDAEQERMRSSLLSSVSHDLRTPLGSIMGAASTLLDPSHLSEDDRAALLLSIHEESSRLNRLLDNLLQMTRIEGGALRVEKDFEVPEELVGAVLARFTDRTRGREIVVEIDEDPPLVPFDALSMDLVLTNVLDNALSHATDGARIWIRGHRTGDRYRFVVEDDGLGVPPIEREAIFEKFRRGGACSGPGAGLGLAICRAIVRAHGGEITAEGRDPAQGLRVVIDLPCSPAPPDEEEST